MEKWMVDKNEFPDQEFMKEKSGYKEETDVRQTSLWLALFNGDLYAAGLEAENQGNVHNEGLCQN